LGEAFLDATTGIAVGYGGMILGTNERGNLVPLEKLLPQVAGAGRLADSQQFLPCASICSP
jgi:hypothetical protein